MLEELQGNVMNSLATAMRRDTLHAAAWGQVVLMHKPLVLCNLPWRLADAQDAHGGWMARMANEVG